MEQLDNLTEAIITLRKIRVPLAGGSTVVWSKVNNAIDYLESQIKAALAE
jgi:hypothetical protein